MPHALPYEYSLQTIPTPAHPATPINPSCSTKCHFPKPRNLPLPPLTSGLGSVYPRIYTTLQAIQTATRPAHVSGYTSPPAAAHAMTVGTFSSNWACARWAQLKMCAGVPGRISGVEGVGSA